MQTIKDVFNAFKQSLASIYNGHETGAITLTALIEITGDTRAKLKAFPEKELSPEQSEKLTAILTRLKTGEPIQYILGYTEFYGLPFKVNPSVLIPRPETEELVQWVLWSAGNGQWAVGSLNILDIGTGSGCIAISLKKNLPGAKVSAIDISNEALEVASQNAELNEVVLELEQNDILNYKSETEHSKFEIIISNPPYVTQHDKTLMHHNVTDFEPHTALFVPENDPLLFYKAIADFAVKNLAIDGLLFFEINEGLGKETVELLTGKGFKNIELRKDMSGRDRMIRAVR